MGSFGGLGAEPPTAGGLAGPAGSSGSRPRRDRVKGLGAEPFASLSLLIAVNRRY